MRGTMCRLIVGIDAILVHLGPIASFRYGIVIAAAIMVGYSLMRRGVLADESLRFFLRHCCDIIDGRVIVL